MAVTRHRRVGNWHGSAHLKRAWMCVRQMRPPGRGNFWILKIAHAPSPKNLSKNGFCPQKRGSISAEGTFAKKFSGAGLDSQERNRQLDHTFGMQVVSIASRPQWEASERLAGRRTQSLRHKVFRCSLEPLSVIVRQQFAGFIGWLDLLHQT
jgi:hypothetical protein